MNKRGIRRLLLGIGYTLLLSIILLIIGHSIGYFNEGAERSSIFNDSVITKAPTVHYKIIEDGNEGVNISPHTLQSLTTDYLNSWRSKNKAFSILNPEVLADHFTPKMQEKYREMITQLKSDSIVIDGCDLSHNIDVTFHNLDMSVAVLEDHNVIQYQSIYTDNKLITTVKDTASYRVTCLREDGNWRIRSMEKISTSSKISTQPKTLNQIKTEQLLGVNYYPSSAPWNLFGDTIKMKTISNDLKLTKAMGASTIRIFIPYEDFGGPWVSKAKLKKLDQLLSIAYEEDLTIVLTFFDFYSNYAVNDWQNTDHHLRDILSMTKDHKANIIYDIKNEPDLDMQPRGTELVADWLSHHIDIIKTIDPNRPTTIGWSNTESATILSDEVDIVSFHYYNKAEDFSADTKLLRKQLPKGKSLLLSEVGMTSYKGLWNPLQFSESKQKDYVHNIVNQVKNMEIGYLVWSLYDYPTVPNQVVGRLPWRKAYQQYYGILNLDGQPKEIADNLFTPSHID